MADQIRTRTEYSVKNTTVAVASRMTAILMGFVTRVVFTHVLSESYVGINGLFTDILNVLALSELGVGTAITYALYKPVAEEETEKQKSIMRLYCWFYRIVALIVLIGGLLVVPFMDVIMKDRPQVEHLTLIYLLYLANSVLSYLLIYKKTLIEAHQLTYIGTLYHTIFLVIQDAAQIVILLATGNFLLFCITAVVCTVSGNVSISRRADRMYPFLKDREIAPLGQQEKDGIIKNVKAMLMHKIGVVIVNNTDNILLSALVGLGSVGKYSNYYLVIGSVRQVLDQVFQGISASVGNLGVMEDEAHIRRIFETSFFIGQWLYGFAAICLYELLSLFVEISFGANYVFEPGVVLVLCLNFYITGMRKATLIFRDSLGLFWYDRYKSIAEAVVNLTVSIVLALRFGTAGVFWGTFISTVTTSLWVEPYVLYKHCLKAPVRSYFAKYAKYAAVLAGVWFVTDRICAQMGGNILVKFLLRLLIAAILPNLLFVLLYGRTGEFREVLAIVKGRIRGKNSIRRKL
ncbi:MAG: lipopolysaccharide biosynthesis protein [Lachnospiraceae bacterium]|nr:lipopolysaccharide biosynthesis protein [Lachnospiraceae bacterium]